MRFLRGLTAAIGLALVLVGAPWALSRWGRWQALATIDWAHALSTRDDGTLLLGLLTGLGWVVWAILSASIVVEFVDTLRRTPWRRGVAVPPLVVPGLDLPRALVRGLVVAAVLAVVGTGTAVAPTIASASGPQVVASAVADPGPEPRAAAAVLAQPPGATPPPGAQLHVVGPHDDLWSLAVTYYGDGSRWRQIADANPDLIQGDRELESGWRLVVPDSAPTSAETIIVVKKGDTLWALAKTHLGNPERWPEIFEANRDVIDDPDEIDIGWRLRIPTVPGAAAPATSPGVNTAPAAATPSADLPVAAPVPSASSTKSATPPPTATPSPQPTTSPSVVTTGEQPPSAVPSVAAASSDPLATPAARPSPGQSSPSTLPAPSPAASATPTEAPPAGPTTTPEAPPDLPIPPAVALVGGVGTLLAGGLVAQLRRRRSIQLAVRPVGRRILHPDEETARVATALGRIAAPDLLAGVDSLTRHLGAERLTGRGLMLLAGPDGVSLTHPGGATQHFREAHVADLIAARPADAEPGSDRPCPVPALVALGADEHHRQVLVDLEAARLVTVELDDPLPTCVAIGLELACSPWAEGVEVVAAGLVSRALAAELENVAHEPDPEAAAESARRRILTQRAALDRTGASLADLRRDADTRDAWAPHVYLFGPDLSVATAVGLRDLLESGPAVAVGVVLAGRQAVPGRAAAAESLVAGQPRRAADTSRGTRIVPGGQGAVLEPYGISFTPQRLPAATAAAVVELLAVTGSDQTTAAPWFEQLDSSRIVQIRPQSSPGPAKEAVAVGPPTSPGVTDFSHPTLLLLGPIELVGAAGPPPPRAERSCIEYCAWLLEHPGATATMMANALVVAEGTRRSNVSRLRSWLGSSPEGEQYLPDAYSGRLFLDACVSSDWHRLQLLIGPGVGRVSRDTLVAALQLVRGAPLADAAPGQWHWAEELRTDMSSTIRDIGVVVAEGAIADGDVDLARWATARALTAAPEDELLLCCRIKAEHRAGNRSEVERLVLRLTRHARLLGIDLADETVRLIQEVIEGRPRARA